MFYLLLIFLITIPLSAMEPVQFSMQDEEPNEKQALLAPQQIVMSDHANQSILYDQSRRYYNHESFEKARKDVFKRCVCHALCLALCAGCIMAGTGESIAGCIAAGGSTNGLCFQQAGCIFVEAGVGCGGASFLCLAPTLGCLYYCDHYRKFTIEPKYELEISSMIKAGDPKKQFWIYKDELKCLLETPSEGMSIHSECTLPILRKLLSCWYCTENSIRKIIAKRIQTKSIVSITLTHQLRKKYRFPKEMIQLLLKFIDFSEINQKTYITEKELFYLRRNYYGSPKQVPQVARTYNNHIFLAENGWISFIKNEQYPIRCELKYFDSHSLPSKAKYWYGATESPIVYLPFDLELAHYYKFENDPSYAREYEKPTSRKIEQLLQIRQEIMGRNSALINQVKNNNNN